jgi:AcrR family transcriptional regulator
MASRQKRNPDISRERILHAATELFAQKGYAGAGVDELAARSTIAKTAIYYHFGNKEGLLAAVIERLATEWIDRIRAVADEASSPLERLDRALAGMRALVEDTPWVLKLFQLMALELAETKPEVRASLLTVAQRARGAIVSGLRDALGAEVPDADAVARVVLALLNGIVLARAIDPDMVPLDHAFADLRRLVVLMVAGRIVPEAMAWLEVGPQRDAPSVKEV